MPDVRDRDDVILAALAQGLTWDETAETAGVSRSTVARRANDPDFRARLDAERRANVERTVLALTTATPRMVARLVAIAEDESTPPAAAVAAIRTALAAAPSWLEAHTFDARLTDMESRLDRHDGGRSVNMVDLAERLIASSPLRNGGNGGHA